MNNISIKQKEMQCLDLLFSQRKLYSSAKYYFGWRTLIALLIAIIGPLLVSRGSSYSVYIGASAIFYYLADILLLEILENSKKEKAAKYQELFDTKVLELPWNDVVVGLKPDIETVALILYKNPNRDYSLLKDWYAVDVDRVELPLARFICQRSNTFWDEELRKRFLIMLYGVIVLMIVSIVILGISFELTIGKFILGIILPVLPLFKLLLKQIKKHREAAKSIAKLRVKLDEVIEKIMQRQPIKDSQELSRTFQDEIFRYRMKCPLIFDWAYRVFRHDQENQLQFSIKNKVDEYLNIEDQSVLGDQSKNDQP